MAAQKVEGFMDERPGPARRYDWPSWTDGSVWEIRRGEDYDVATENMRVNLHMKASQLGRKVRTQIVRDGGREGLRFQFYPATGREGDAEPTATRPSGGGAPPSSERGGERPDDLEKR